MGTKYAMFDRIQSNCLYLRYELIKQKSVQEKIVGFSDILFVKKERCFEVILYKKNRFDIRSEEYIHKKFQIQTCIPTVVGMTKKAAFEHLKNTFLDPDVELHCIVSTGIFQEHLTYLKTVHEGKVLQKLRNELKVSHEGFKQQTTQVTINNITNVVIPELYKGVRMNPLGMEDMSAFNVEDLLSILNTQESITMIADVSKKLVELIHFDRRCPENQNIHLTQKNNFPECVVYLESGWNLCKNIDHLIPLICKSNKEFISCIYNTYADRCNSLDIATQGKLRSIYEMMKDPYSNPAMFGLTNAIYSLTKTKLPQLHDSIIRPLSVI